MLDAENPADEESTATTSPETPAGSPAAPEPADGPDAAAPKRATAKKTAAKKATAKKAAAKKTAAKKAPAKRATKKATADDAAEAAAEAPAKKATARKTAKKAAAKTTAKRAGAKAAKKAAEPADVPTDAAATAGGEPAGEPAEQPSADVEAAAPPVAAPVPLFQPPAPTRAPSRRKKAAPVAEGGAEDPASTIVEGAGDATGDTGTDKPAPRTRSRKAATPKPQEADEEAVADEPADQDEDDQDDQGSGSGNRRRRRRGGRRRRRSGESDAQDNESDEASSKPDVDEKPEGDGDSPSSRRRRRRRRSGDEDSGSDDPANTVTRVRKPRNPEDEITALSGSTRLEAKKQRRREGREAGRRRAPIVSEAEFLARREAVDRVMVIRQRKDLTQIAVLEDKVLVEHYVARESQTSLIGNVYLGRVQNVLPSMEAAFIDIGKGRNAVLYAGEVNWDSLGAGNGPRKIEQVLKSGQPVLVQVTKDPVGHKGARLTSQVSLPGRFLVYVPDGTTSGISRKLPDTERNRLKTLLKEIVPETAGVIVRTAAEGASEEELTRDVERLTARWEDISAKVEKGNAPQLLYGEPDLTLKVVRDLFTEDFGRLVVSGDEAWDMVENYVGHVAPDLGERLERYDGDQDVFAAYRIDEQIAKALDRKVWLPSGGSLVIDRTEAMTVVDVNTGKFTGSGGNLEETVTKNNLEAAEEIVRQLRLRDIGGIIVVDFIDMVLESNRDLVLRRLVECLGRDRTRHQVAEVTSLGLVQMTRKRIGTGLVEAFSESCEHCQGRGLVIHHEPVDQRKKQDEEPRRGRRGRGRGDSDGDASSAAPPPPPSPKEVAAMAKAGRQAPAVSEDDEAAAAVAGADEAATDGSASSAGATEAPDATVGDGQSGSRSSRGRRRGGRSRAADNGAETGSDETRADQTAADGTSETVEPSAKEEPAPDARPRTSTRSGRGSSRRPAGPPAVTAPAAPVIVVPPAADLAVSQPADGASTDDAAPSAPVARVVTSSRRRVARRPAGPPVGGPAPDSGPNGAPTGGDAAEPVGADAEDPTASPVSDPAEAATAPVHVPIKKKGSRKR